MKRQKELARRLSALEGLHGAVTAMKSLSAHHFRETRAGVEPARRYRDGVLSFRAFAGGALPPGQGKVGLLVVGAELGLCGGYNAHVVALAEEHRRALGDGPTFCVGRRARAMLRRRGVRVDHEYAGPAGVTGITPLLLTLAEDALTAYETEHLAALDVVASRFEGVGRSPAVVTRLLPLAPAVEEAPPAARYVTAGHLGAAVLRELLFILLYDLLLDALAAEHGARIVATQAAEDWLERASGDVRRQLVSARREASTQEVVEIASGARARSR